MALNMGLTDYESEAFWPVYDEYWAEMKKLGDRGRGPDQRFRQELRVREHDKPEGKGNAPGVAFDQEDTVKLQEKYAKKFRKVLPEKKVLRYFQIENKLDLIIDSELSAEIPLAR